MAQTSGSRPSAATGESSPEETSGTRGRNIPESRVSGESPARRTDDTTQGRTTIAASVVQKISGIATREISGVHAMGGGVSRAFGAIRERIPGGSGTSSMSGVQVEVGEKQAAIDLDIVVEYGTSIVDLARAVRRNVITGVERMTGLEVIEVNIAVNDVHLPSEDGEGTSGEPTTRVE